MPSLLMGGAGPASAGVAFAPTDIAGLQAWYEADVGTSTTTDGVAISQWNDQSGNARHLTQATGANQPLYKAAILNGKPVVRFDGANDAMVMAALSIAQPTTIFVVAQSTTTTGNKALFDGTTSRQHIYFDATGPPGSWRYTAGTDLGTAVTTDLAAHSYSVNFNGASSGFWRDGTLMAGGNPGANALTALIVGTNSVSTAPWAGDIAALLFYDSSLSVANRQNVESYLRSKYALP